MRNRHNRPNRHRDFLEEAIGPLEADDKLAFVQTRWLCPAHTFLTWAQVGVRTELSILLLRIGCASSCANINVRSHVHLWRLGQPNHVSGNQ